MEERGRPTVALCDRGFLTDAKSAASSRGMPGLRSLGVVGSSPTDEQIRTEVSASIDDIIAALTRPLSQEERSPTKEVEKPPRAVFKGSLEEVNRFFYKRGWTDGLPVMPPTEEAVAEMLAGTDLPRDHVVAKIIPRLGKATVEKIAVNAVMAGALPTYMPLLVAGIQALMEPKMEFGTWGVSTGSWAPCWIINGPVRKDLHLNSGAGTLSPGDIANAAIGRAMSLIIKNIGGIRKGVEDMGVMGNPMKYTMVIGENEDESPWPPFHVDRGFKREDSAITLFFPNSYTQTLSYSADDKGILATVTHNLAPGRRDGQTLIMLHPPHATTLASAGWTKDRAAAFVAENAKVPLSHHPWGWGSFTEDARKKLPANPEEPIPLIPFPDRIKFVVAGGPGAFMGIIRGSQFDSEGRGTDFVTKKIELPSNWANLVKKYKNVVPTYAGY